MTTTVNDHNCQYQVPQSISTDSLLYENSKNVAMTPYKCENSQSNESTTFKFDFFTIGEILKTLKLNVQILKKNLNEVKNK